MKKLWGRISMEMTVTDEEYESIKKSYPDSEPIPDQLALRMLKNGSLSQDSYVYFPEFDWGEEERL